MKLMFWRTPPPRPAALDALNAISIAVEATATAVERLRQVTKTGGK